MDVPSTGDALGEPPHERFGRGDVRRDRTDASQPARRGGRACRSARPRHRCRPRGRSTGWRAGGRAGRARAGRARDRDRHRRQPARPEGLPDAAAAARRLVDRGVPFRMVAVGQGPLERKIAARRNQLGLREYVVLAGFRPDALAVMAACDVFVLASAWEGLPVAAAMEAAALGLPIVATAVGGVAEQLGLADAVLVPPRDPVALAGAARGRRRRHMPAVRPVGRGPLGRDAASTSAGRWKRSLPVTSSSPERRRARPDRRPRGLRAPTRQRCVRRRPRTGNRSSPSSGVARLDRRPSGAGAVRVEARTQPVRALARLGGRTRRTCRCRPPVHALDVPTGASTVAR